MRLRAPRRDQQGMVLLITLIMLVLVTLLVVGAFNLGKSNLQIIGNMQNHDEAVATAQAAIEEVVSTTNFSESPSAAFDNALNVKPFTVNGRSNAFEVTLLPQPCIKSYQNLAADPADASSQGCIAGQQQNFGVAGTSTSGSSCADIVWEITAVAKDTLTSATTTVVQGMRIRQDAAAATSTTNYCS